MEYLSNLPQLIEYKNPRDLLIEQEIVNGVEEILDTLTDREKKIIKLIFFERNTLDKCGKLLNVSKERIRQIRDKALRKIRHPSRSNKLKELFGIETLKEEPKKEKTPRKIYNKPKIIVVNRYEDWWSKRIKFTQLIRTDVDHPYFLPSSSDLDRINRIFAYAEYYNTDLEELKLIFDEKDIELAYFYQDSQ